MEKIKILWVGDGVIPTGFSTVNHNIIKNLPKDEYEIHHLAINYWGDPHGYDHFIYPAARPEHAVRGDLYGYARIEELVNLKPDIIFILNDIWVIMRYLERLREIYEGDVNKKIPKIVVYFPVDGYGYSAEWFKDFNIVSKMVVYTKFGYDTVKQAVPLFEPTIIPHGTDTELFFKSENKTEIKKEIFKELPELWGDSFIVLNANRNQPRKRLDLSLTGFALFATGKPDNVRYYHHAGTKDVGWDFVDLLKKIDKEFNTDVEARIILTNMEHNVQRVPISKLNKIYNACDVGINTSLGEGWGLTSTEHAATGAVQVVPGHTACRELFEDCGEIIPVCLYVRDPAWNLNRGFVHPKDIAKGLQNLYEDKERFAKLAKKSYEKFTSLEYQWTAVGKQWDKLFKSIL
jgi:glycosyltransferase involved in cell wall biosynthesis